METMKIYDVDTGLEMIDQIIAKNEENFMDRFYAAWDGVKSEKIEIKPVIIVKSEKQKILEDIEKQIADWNSRVYKSNKATVMVHGDCHEYRNMTISSINEKRRSNKIRALVDQYNMVKKYMKD